MTTPAQIRALQLMPLSELGLTIHRIRKDMLLRMQEAGLCKFRPYGNPPSWKVTSLGRSGIREDNLK